VSADLGSREDPWTKLAAIWAQADLVRTNAMELEQLGLTLSGRDVSSVDRADLVSYVVWISQFASQNALVLANWGFGLVGYMDSTLRSAGLTHPHHHPPQPRSRLRPRGRRVSLGVAGGSHDPARAAHGRADTAPVR
jgi:hypothetical protein